MQPGIGYSISRIRLTSFVLAFSACITAAFGGQSKIGQFVGWEEISCYMTAEYTVEVENINPTFAIQGINATFEVRREGALIHSQMLQGPPNARLTPGQKFNFLMALPEEFTLIDGVLDFLFSFNSNFDLNPNPTKTAAIPVIGCGILIDDAQNYMRDYVGQHTDIILPEDAIGRFESIDEAHVYYYPKLLKPDTWFKDPFDADVAVTDAFSLMFTVDWFPYDRFEKPVTLLTLNTITLEVTPVQMSWYPVVFDPGATQGTPFILDPFLKKDYIIRGTQPEPEPPPFPLSGDPVASVPADRVCAILISGTDKNSTLNAESFQNDVETMRRYLTENSNGPKLPMSSILTLHGIGKDSLRVHLAALKNNYDKVYLYYSGHGSKSGKMCLGMTPADWMTYEELMDELYNSNAEDLYIFLDCCYSGKVLQPACGDSRIQQRNVEIYTSSDDQKISGSRFHLENGMRVKRGVMTSQMYKQSLDASRDANRDGMVSLCESFDAVVQENPYSVRTLHNPQKKVELNARFTQLSTIFQQGVAQMYGQDVVNTANLRIYPELLGANIDIYSFDMQAMLTTTDLSYFGWIDWEPENLFGKPVEFVLVDGQTYTITVTRPAQFWPVIPATPNFDPFSSTYLIQDNAPIFFGTVGQTVHNSVSSVDPGDRVCALIVTGTDPRPEPREGLSTTADIMKANLMAEELGPRLPDKNIRVEKFITADSLRKILMSMQGKYDKVYFYYMGHGVKEGFLEFAKHAGDRMSHLELLTALDAVGADENCVIIEACYSGLIQKTLESSGTFKNRHIEIFTSSSENKRTGSMHYFQNGIRVGHGAFGYFLMKCYGDPAAEKDGITGTSFKEAFEWVRKMNPAIPGGSLFARQCPTYSVRRHINASGSKPLEYTFEGLDFRLRVQQRVPTAIDLDANVLFDMAEKTVGPDENVLAISPLREWSLSGELTVDPQMVADLQFLYDPSLDSIYSSYGVLGLVHRADDSSDWEAYYPSYYDIATETIIAENVSGAGQWAIARIADMSSSLDDLSQVFPRIVISPNPVPDGYAYVFVESERQAPLQISVVSLNGLVCQEISDHVEQGESTIPVDISGILPGMYFVKLTSEGRTGSIPVVIR